ncbi:hypothetical protein EZY14_018150 [Kordia sp. TARA_039_SRF]|nr:hypothetical protein EZY14_018150 [Kordia sp. TARA_039_SRF]
MKKLRKPYVSCILVLLLFFTSCSQFESDIEEVENSLSLKEFVEKHIELSSNMLNLLENRDLENITSLNILEDNLTYEQLQKILHDANIEKANSIIELAKEMRSNGINFMNSVEYKSLNKSKLESEIINEIYEQLNESYPKSGPCEDKYRKAQGACTLQYTIATGASVVAGSFTLGFGWLVGAGGALINYTICMVRADNALEDCLAQ